LTGRVGCQAAADPDHRSTNRASDAARRPGGRGKSLPADGLAQLAPAKPVDLNVVRVDQHLWFTSFLLV